MEHAEDGMRIRNVSDLLLGTALLLIAAFLYHETYFFREVHSFSFGPRIFPRVILGITGFCSVILILQSLTLGETRAEAKRESKPESRNLPVLIMRVGMLALLLLYAATLRLVGYVPGTIAFLFLTMLLLGVRTPKYVLLYAVISVISAFSLSYIFGTLLRLFLP